MITQLSPADVLAVLQPWAETAEPIHRRLAQLVDVEPSQEVLWVGADSVRSVLWWAERVKTRIVGLDPDPDGVEFADRSARAAGLVELTTFQGAPVTDLPYEARVFDAVVVHMLSLLGSQSSAVIAEAARVARPMATVVALVPSWLRAADERTTRLLENIGIQPQLVVEWKASFREAGVVELMVEDAARDGRWMAYGWLGLLVRGWRAARWKGVRFVLSREFRVLRSLALHRVLGLSIIKGTRWPHE